jgi:hypothetical protein
MAVHPVVYFACNPSMDNWVLDSSFRLVGNLVEMDWFADEAPGCRSLVDCRYGFGIPGYGD